MQLGWVLSVKKKKKQKRSRAENSNKTKDARVSECDDAYYSYF